MKNTGKVKIQIYLTPEQDALWRAAATREGVSLTTWVVTKVQAGRLLGTALKNLHGKVDQLLESK